MSRSTIIAITPFDSKCQYLHMSPKHFPLDLTVAKVKKFYISELQKVGQGHGVQFKQLHQMMANVKIVGQGHEVQLSNCTKWWQMSKSTNVFNMGMTLRSCRRRLCRFSRSLVTSRRLSWRTINREESRRVLRCYNVDERSHQQTRPVELLPVAPDKFHPSRPAYNDHNSTREFIYNFKRWLL